MVDIEKNLLMTKNVLVRSWDDIVPHETFQTQYCQ